MEYKNIPLFTKAIDGRTVTGIFAVHGNVDEGGDMSVNGAFTAGLNTGRKRVRFLWNHNSMNPPIASIQAVREVGREELPAKVLGWAPDATGGVEVTREYYEDADLARWVFTALVKGDVGEMSYAYEVHDFDYVEREGRPVRVLKEVELYDISDVNWGMNPATAGVKMGGLGSGLPFTQHSAMVEAAIVEFAERAKTRSDFRQKEGRVLSQANRERIGKLLELLTQVSGELKELLDATEPKARPEEVLSVYARYLQIQSQILGGIPHA